MHTFERSPLPTCFFLKNPSCTVTVFTVHSLLTLPFLSGSHIRGAFVFSLFILSPTHFFFFLLHFSVKGWYFWERGTLGLMFNRCGTSGTNARLSRAEVTSPHVFSPDCFVVVFFKPVFDFHLFLLLRPPPPSCSGNVVLFLHFFPFCVCIFQPPTVLNPPMLPHILSVWIRISFEQFHPDKSL